VSINLAGMFWALQAELPEIEKNSGASVNAASVGGLVGVPGLSAYAASKWGVIGLTTSVALEYATRGVRINAIAPGATATEMLMSGSQESRDFLTSLAPIKRIQRAPGKPLALRRSLRALGGHTARAETRRPPVVRGRRAISQGGCYCSRRGSGPASVPLAARWETGLT
jgi:NAD(P)-dependent dehydrogenase (short-subunit alcohol dehydrogenase family)